jgi:hypothetical protein
MTYTAEDLRRVLRDDTRAMFTDEDLAMYVRLFPDSILRAAGECVRSVAILYAAKGKSTKTDDLAVDLRSRGKDLLAVARSFIEDADAESAAEAAEYFNIVPTGGGRQRCHAEGDSFSW